MLFNSYGFIFIFLPITLIGYLTCLYKVNHKDAAKIWLIAASLFFYGWWNANFLMLFVTSMLGNYWLGYQFTHNIYDKKTTKRLFIGGIVLNLCAIGVFKYAAFGTQTLNDILNTDFIIPSFILPLAISFYTFQQIAYLIECYYKRHDCGRFIDFFVFVTFFPHLIAGPIVRFQDLMAVLKKDNPYRHGYLDFYIGLSIFIFGLFKKVVLADNIAPYSSAVFDNPTTIQNLDFFAAWFAALSYTLQLYFDFSGYSDMAIGLARMFGFMLPLNFNSPYKAKNIIDFWRRWHITLSHFLRDYLYIPLGGNRHGIFRRHFNLLLTMLIGGLWHGAGWTFIFWGFLHGSYLIINHIFINIIPQWVKNFRSYQFFAWFVTLVAVIVAWVFFRSHSFADAVQILKSMVGYNGFILPQSFILGCDCLQKAGNFIGLEFDYISGRNFVENSILIFILFIIVIKMPNTQHIMRKYKPALYVHYTENNKILWRPNAKWACIVAIMFITSLLNMTQVSEFLYYQF